jgi:hypothetical protein
MYYNVMTMTVMVILNSCSLKDIKTITTIRAKYMRAQNVLTVSATRTCSSDVWNIDVELVRTRFHSSLVFHTAKFSSGTAAILVSLK